MTRRDIEPTPRPGPDHERLDVLVGRWRTEGLIIEGPSGATSRLTAVDTYEWLPGRFFLVHHAAGHMGDEEVRSIEIIGVDASSGGYRTHSFDNHGNAATYTASLLGRVWRIEGATERFAGEFADDGGTLTGRWERSTDGVHWQPWMEITLTRAAPAV